MALTARQKAFYQHTFSVFRCEGVVEDELGNPIAGAIVKAVPGIQNVTCKLHETPQYDTRRAPGISLNQDSLMTADELRFERTLDVRGKDYVRIVNDLGTVLWYRTAGEPRTKGKRANSAHVFLQRTPPPTVED